MINISDEQLESVRNQLADAEPEAVGYRLMIRPRAMTLNHARLTALILA
jgi:hypothetical protein